MCKSCWRKPQKTHAGTSRKAVLQLKHFKRPDSNIWRKVSCFKQLFTDMLANNRKKIFATLMYSLILSGALVFIMLAHSAMLIQCEGNLWSAAAGSLATKLSFIYPLKICTSEEGWGDNAASTICHRLCLPSSDLS